MRKIIIIAPVLFILSACSSIAKRFGVNRITKFDKERCEKFIGSLDLQGIAVNKVYIDIKEYGDHREIPGNEKNKKDFSQPVQILYFENDSLVSFHANCYARPRGASLNWNTVNRFDKFVPASATGVDSMNASLEKVSRNFLKENQVNRTKYTVFIVWGTMLERISGEAIETVLSNIKKFNKSGETTVYLVNNDQALVKML